MSLKHRIARLEKQAGMNPEGCRLFFCEVWGKPPEDVDVTELFPEIREADYPLVVIAPELSDEVEGDYQIMSVCGPGVHYIHPDHEHYDWHRERGLLTHEGVT